MKKLEFRKDPIGHSVRAAQSILQYGVGAMVDFPDQTLMTAAPETWGEKRDLYIIRDERLERMLDVDYFAHPLDKSDPAEKGITYARFPEWYFCPKCRKLEPLSYWIGKYRQSVDTQKHEDEKYMVRPVCMDVKCRTGKTGINLVPARIIVACEHGHIDDFPWIEWVHARKEGGVCNNPHLVFVTGTISSAGLEGVTIECETCKARESLEHSFDKDGLSKKIKNYHCAGKMPWKNAKTHCMCTPQAKQRGASTVYYPKVDSSLVIPPYSDRLRTAILESQAFEQCILHVRSAMEYGGLATEEAIEKVVNKEGVHVANSVHHSEEAVRPLIETLLREKYMPCEKSDKSSAEVYRQAEYAALNGSSRQCSDDADFIREERMGSEYNIPGVTQVALLHKIREVRALVGFTRLEPPSSGELGIPHNDLLRFQCVKKKETRWYPGYEVRGEGIFIQFDNDYVCSWLAESEYVQRQVAQLQRNAAINPMVKTQHIHAKFIFLHTIAHLLIQRMSFESGYSTASLRERIYCDIDHPEFPMCGIFIYTACGDSEGTLGGLVRQGIPQRLEKIFYAAMENACWCSNDPVCSDSHGQGRNAMNLAACHACALLPETSCEEFNILLDRTILVGQPTNRSVGYFSEWLNHRESEE